MKLETVKILKHINAEQTGLTEISDEQLHELQQVLLSITDDIVEVCRENQLDWFLIGGSAIGAMRHQGFIPWDDDIDLGMPRQDYDHFLDCFRKKYGEKYWIQEPQQTKGYGILLAKVRLKGTVFRSRDDFTSDQCGIFVDIFIVENVSDNRLVRTAHGVCCLGADFLLSCRKFYEDREPYLALVRDQPEGKKVFQKKIAIGHLLSWASLDAWRRWADNVHRACGNIHSKYVSIVADFGHFFGDMYLRSDLCETRQVPFEGRSWNVPKNVEKYLSHVYGDYMQIPKPEDRERHFLLEFRLPETSSRQESGKDTKR